MPFSCHPESKLSRQTSGRITKSFGRCPHKPCQPQVVSAALHAKIKTPEKDQTESTQELTHL